MMSTIGKSKPGASFTRTSARAALACGVATMPCVAAEPGQHGVAIERRALGEIRRETLLD